MTPFPVLLLFYLLSPSVCLHFTFPTFDPISKDIQYEGDAVNNASTIEFNRLDHLYRVGQVTYANTVHIWDSGSGALTDFTTHFAFSIDTQGKINERYGHGFAFFLAPVGFHIPLNSGAGYLGLYNTTTRYALTENQIVSVEFDTYSDGWDPDSKTDHVGININSLSSVRHVIWNASLHSGDTANVWVTYNASTKTLSVYWTYELNPVFRGESHLFYVVDLKEILQERVVIGFSAATGKIMQRHILKSWEFNSSLNVNDKREKHEDMTKFVVALVVPAVVLIGGGIGVAMILWRKHCAKRTTVGNCDMSGDFERGSGPKKFTYKELVLATNNFADDRKLGEGGFGCVYRGLLSPPEIAVAVKKISKGSRQGKKEYITEVKTISLLRHRNLVQLIGWCHDRGDFLLVYEFMPNGSLDRHLFGQGIHLTWAVRYKITLGLASALLYLHEAWEQCVVHRDIKSSNLMLDSGFNAKLGDFGLARLMDHERDPKTTDIAGTIGYLAPEYIHTGKASKESDVFSFGVVALEIASGRRSADPMGEESRRGLVEWAWDLYGREELVSVVDEKLGLDYDVKQVECLMMVGLWCAHPDHISRPSIKQAIQVLNFDSRMPVLPTKMPVPSFHLPEGQLQVSSSEPSITTASVQIGGWTV